MAGFLGLDPLWVQANESKNWNGILALLSKEENGRNSSLLLHSYLIKTA
jgi:hypothetical protein